MADSGEGFGGYLIGTSLMALVGLIGCGFAEKHVSKHWQQEAVEHGAAVWVIEEHQQKWYWKDELPKQQQKEGEE